MSQHDYVIDNANGPTVRADLNNALAAIVTQNGGATAPTNTFAGMPWMDTNNDKLMRRDATNSSWKWVDRSVVSLLGDNVGAAGGTSDAITVTLSSSISSLSEIAGIPFWIKAAYANTTTTPTVSINGLTATTIVKGVNSALAVGDIAGAGHWLELQYDATLNKWVLQNPAKGVNAVSVKQIQTVQATVAANALTLSLAATSLDFRSATVGSGVVNTRSVPATISIVVPSGATLGTINATPARLVLLAIDNVGTVELAVVNLAGGTRLDETGVISTTAISAAATASNVIYSTTARSNVPYRVVGFVDITEATAGTWATAPATIQGVGGQALASLSSLGYGQTWQSVGGSRATGTTYYNTTGRPIAVAVMATTNTATTAALSLFINGINFGGEYCSMGVTGAKGSAVFGIVPPGGSYSVSTTGSPTISYWNELR